MTGAESRAVPLPKSQRSRSSTPRTDTLARERFFRSATTIIAIAGIAFYLLLRFALHLSPVAYHAPLVFVLVLDGVPLVIQLARKAWSREFGSDLLAGLAILVAVVQREYL